MLLVVSLIAAGCSPGYVLRAGYEEAKILWRRQPIASMLRQPDLDAGVRDKLELVLEARRFAQTRLHLRVGGSYGSYAAVDDSQVVWVVTAAERLQLKPYRWWFPIVGRVPYKGYFDRSDANTEAAQLEGQGYDTLVRPAAAFSTLGWFDDPLLSSVLRYDEVTLVEVIIHELLHNTMYVAGHADFDESFANFVGNRGAIAFFAERRDAGSGARAQQAWDDTLAFSEFLGQQVERLRQSYDRGMTLELRDRMFGEMQTEFRSLQMRTNIFAAFAARPLNNAVILHYLVYVDRLRLFERLWQQRGEDLAAVIHDVQGAVTSRAQDPFAAVEAVVGGAPAAPAL